MMGPVGPRLGLLGMIGLLGAANGINAMNNYEDLHQGLIDLNHNQTIQQQLIIPIIHNNRRYIKRRIP